MDATFQLAVLMGGTAGEGGTAAARGPEGGEGRAEGGEAAMSITRRTPWQGSTRASRLPKNWPALRAEADRRNPRRICHWCGLPGGDELDHIIPGDDHRQENLDWIHGRRAVEAGRSLRNCHGEKSSSEGGSARPSVNRPPEVHPALK